MPQKPKYNPGVETFNFGVGRFRVDLYLRLKALAKARRATINELMNDMVENGLNLYEAAARRRQRESWEAVGAIYSGVEERREE